MYRLEGSLIKLRISIMPVGDFRKDRMKTNVKEIEYHGQEKQGLGQLWGKFDQDSVDIFFFSYAIKKIKLDF